MNNCIHILNFVKARALNSRNLSLLCEEMRSETKSLLFHTSLRWVSRAKVLSRFFELQHEISQFISSQNNHHLYEHPKDDRRFAKLAYSAGLTIVAIATGPALLGTPRSSVINLICYIVYKTVFSLRSQYFAKFSISRKRRFSFEKLSVSRNSCLIIFVQLRTKRQKIAVSSVAISTDLLLLNLAGFSHC